MIFRLLWTIGLAVIVSALSGQYTRGVLSEEDKEYSDLLLRTPLVTRSYTVHPPKVSLRKYAPLPGSQGSYGNCTGWATAYCARTILYAKGENLTDRKTITKNAYSPGFTFLQGGGKGAKCSGAFTTGVVRSLTIRGAVRNRDVASQKVAMECPQFPLPIGLLNQAEDNKIPPPLTLWSPGEEDPYIKISRTKLAITAGHPVVISMVVPKSFEGEDTGGSVGKDGKWEPETKFPTDYDKRVNCHAMTVIGFDDDRFGGSFEVQNSWGAEWGDEGYGWVAYEDFANFTYQAFEVFLSPAKERNWKLGKQELVGKLRLKEFGGKDDFPVTLSDRTRNWTVGSNNGECTYKVAEKLPLGIRMQIFIESEQPAYVYLLGTGSENPKVDMLFPRPGYSAALNYNDYKVALPGENEFLTDNRTGTNNLIVLYSAEELKINEIISNLNEDTSRPISERLDANIRRLLIDSENVQFSKDEIAFKAKITDEKKAFALILQSEHGE
ncbi:C1 family peptidase [Neolewinella agarilytica]|uniref:Peptidase C1-like family protein n=1 Tax=Neolewinella agarilytica TaxID=478744 RepID=A0A1H9A8M3_9BACT|nr:DUF4384 domain-containing protein [Neolewinella agarilytica]SEP73014.1 Peptidase C1-like family protein [Neolewinella agarilytica]